ncbi:hypothetical protein MMC30_003801 [Trapelia coarctata]|nr:hypothetical protein [Trapelia coarctata]
MASTSSLPPQNAEYLQEDIGYQAFGCAVAFIVLEILTVGLRYFARYITKTRPGWDDWLILPCLFFSVAVCALVIAMVNHGSLGRHEIALLLESPSALVLYGKLEIAFTLVYIFALTGPKLVILSLYLRIFVDKPYRIACYVVMGSVVLYSIMAIIITSLMCIPLDFLWNPTITNARCIDILSWWRYSSLPNIVIDCIMLVLPVPVILKIKLPNKDKFGLLLTFAAGGVGVIAAIVRLVVFFQNDAFDDGTWTGVKLALAGIVETGTYLIAACLPAFRPLYLYVRKQGQFSTLRQTAVSKTIESNTPAKKHLRHDNSNYALSSVDSSRWQNKYKGMDPFERVGTDEESLVTRITAGVDHRNFEEDDSLGPSGIEENKIRVRSEFDVNHGR